MHPASSFRPSLQAYQEYLYYTKLRIILKLNKLTALNPRRWRGSFGGTCNINLLVATGGWFTIKCYCAQSIKNSNSIVVLLSTSKSTPHYLTQNWHLSEKNKTSSEQLFCTDSLHSWLAPWWMEIIREVSLNSKPFTYHETVPTTQCNLVHHKMKIIISKSWRIVSRNGTRIRPCWRTAQSQIHNTLFLLWFKLVVDTKVLLILILLLADHASNKNEYEFMVLASNFQRNLGLNFGQTILLTFVLFEI